jgi:hypothetical protein
MKKKTKAELIKKTQKVFNEFIRLRDKDLPCISCGKHRPMYHAGHYRSTGSHPELRFNEDNCHKQCPHCNLFKSGNLIDYRINLIKKIGEPRVEVLENYTPPKKYTISELEWLISFYKERIVEISK